MRTSLVVVAVLSTACAHVASFNADSADHAASCKSPDACSTVEGTADDALLLSLAGAGLVGVALYHLVPLLRSHRVRSL
jgi:hypothetical protein